MFEWLLVNHCAPTLSGLKTANLFMYSGDNAIEKVKYWNKILFSFGIRLRILKNMNGKSLIYIYKVEFLDKILKNNNVIKFLSEYGYGENINVGAGLNLLSHRIYDQDFPHEIGIFLGYPLQDVKLFIKNRGKNYKVSGVWKVYTDANESMQMFKMYKDCTNRLCESYLNGKKIVELCIS